MRKTIKQKVLNILRDGDCHTTTEFLKRGLYTFRNRLSECRKEGYEFEVKPVKGKNIYKYKLINENS